MRINIELKPDLHRELKMYCAETGMTLKAVVSLILERGLSSFAIKEGEDV